MNIVIATAGEKLFV